MIKGQDILKEVRVRIDDVGYSRYYEINQAYRKICKLTKFSWLRDFSETILSFEASTTEYILDMSNMRVMTGLYVKGGNDARYKMMEEVNPALFEIKVRENQDVNGTDTTSKPAFYKIDGGGPEARIFITPTPDQAYTVRVNWIRSTQTIAHDVSVNIPTDYFDTVAMLAAGYILERLPDPERKQYGATLIARATDEFEDLVRDSHPNRLLDIDRKPQAWLK